MILSLVVFVSLVSVTLLLLIHGKLLAAFLTAAVVYTLMVRAEE